MLDQVEAQASIFRKEARKEKKLRKEAEDSAVKANKSLAIVRNTLQETEATRAALAARAEEAETRLEPVTQELATLKGQITAMCRAIFGRKNHTLVQQPLVKLKAVYTFVEQLYIGGSRCIMAAKNTTKSPQLIADMLKELSIVPKWFEDWKKAACRTGALTALARAKAYVPELDSAQIVGGYPEFNVDDSPFTKKDFQRCIKEIRVAATEIAEEADLTKYQAGYLKENERMEPPNHEPVSVYMYV